MPFSCLSKNMIVFQVFLKEWDSESSSLQRVRSTIIVRSVLLWDLACFCNKGLPYTWIVFHLLKTHMLQTSQLLLRRIVLLQPWNYVFYTVIQAHFAAKFLVALIISFIKFLPSLSKYNQLAKLPRSKFSWFAFAL